MPFNQSVSKNFFNSVTIKLMLMQKRDEIMKPEKKEDKPIKKLLSLNTKTK